MGYSTTGLAMATDLPCGCRTKPKERLCSYHEGRADERDIVAQYLEGVGHGLLADRITRGAHIDGPVRDD